MDCPDENALLDYAEGRLDAADAEGLDEHLDRCPDCREVVAPLIGRPRKRRSLRPGDRAGRFVIGEPLGHGGMGVVHAAHDTELHRKVAVKVLRLHGEDGRDHAARLAREAQAIARVSHPNVVAVYQIGELRAGELFVAMEYVDGVTLRRWLAEATRDPDAVLRVMLDAGRGLAAAHRAGVVHRDFKPDNVMIAYNGVAKVLDFGLALAGPWTATDSSGAQYDSADLGPRAGDGFVPGITRTGTVMGTPAYMAPEQHEGRVDERCDQFAFCVVLFEALFRRRAFEGTSAEDLAEAKQRGIEIPRGGTRALRSVLARGLRPDPADRFESMAALLDALQARSWPSQRPAIAIAAGVVAIATAGWAATREGTTITAPIEASATPAAVSTVQQQTIERVKDLRWQGQYNEALALCDRELASDAPPTFAAALLIERGLARAAASAVKDAYADYARAFELAQGAGADAIAARAALMAANVGAFQTSTLVDPQQWLEHADPLIERVGDPIELVQLREATLAKLANARGDGATAEPHARRELALAEQMGEPARIATALSSLGGAVWALGDLAEAERLFRREIDLTRANLGDDHPSLASGLINLGTCQAARMDLDAAEANLREALGVLARSGAHRRADIGHVWTELGKIAMMRGDIEGAAAARTQALAMIEGERGPDNPWVAHALYDLALVHFARGTIDEAEPLLWRAVAIVQAARGDEAEELALFYNALADIEHNRERLEAALELRQRATAIVGTQSEGGDDLPGYIALGRGRDLVELGRLEEAEAVIATLPSSTLPLRERDAPVLEVQGRIALRRGRADEAVALLDRAVELLAEDLSADALRRIALLRSFADALDAAGVRARDAARVRAEADALSDALP